MNINKTIKIERIKNVLILSRKGALRGSDVSDFSPAERVAENAGGG